jgi:hypothetical protein
MTQSLMVMGEVKNLAANVPLKLALLKYHIWAIIKVKWSINKQQKPLISQQATIKFE